MELMPRITRAQVMDVLSSQANLACDTHPVFISSSTSPKSPRTLEK
jgi:NAD/NADP transhydrogenase alpha subunit